MLKIIKVRTFLFFFNDIPKKGWKNYDAEKIINIYRKLLFYSIQCIQKAVNEKLVNKRNRGSAVNNS